MNDGNREGEGDGKNHSMVSTQVHHDLLQIPGFFLVHPPVTDLGSTPKLQSASSEAACSAYLTVESDDPVTMTLSSYCRHNTEPV